MAGKWDFWIDCGGTFTDIVAISDTGEHRVEKLLSQSPHYKSSVVEGVKNILKDDFRPERIASIRLGTTVATNAFLERKGIACALVTTLGFRDVLEIRQQNRPHLFELDIKKITPLYQEVAQVKERVDSKGNIVVKLDEEIARFELQRIYDKGIRSVAISLMHSPLNPSHEKQVGEIAKHMGFEYVSLSHEVSPASKYIFRAETSVADAYLSPLLDIYTKELERDLGGVDIKYMQSSGGLCDARSLKGQNTLLSGPAGGLIGAVESSKKRGIDKIITFDMGGTSTDVAIYYGELVLDHEPEFHGLKLLAPMMDIHTVAAGGGSILKYDDGRFIVGPESAGAYPGPACYRNGGPLTVTDANVYLGRIEVEKFPKIFGPNRDQALDKEIVARKFEKLAAEAGMDPKAVALGFLDVAANTMARAIKKVTVERGHDPGEFTLVAFGGAAGQMACKVAEAIGMDKVFFHPFSSVLSAYGIGHANESISLAARKSLIWENVSGEGLKDEFGKLHKRLNGKMTGIESFEDKVVLKGKGSDYEIIVSFLDKPKMELCFCENYRRLFGLDFTGEIEFTGVISTGIKKSGFHGELVSGEISKEVIGPNVLSANNTCIVFDEGWKGVKNKFGEWCLSRGSGKKIIQRDKKIELEIFYQRFQSIAEQMGYTLQNLAHSITIKERNDFSCAIFTENGELLANAPHIPVHLGSMGDAVVSVKEKFAGAVALGDSFICNDPNFGGTHLPDITVVTPVYLEGKPRLWVASRAHHSDIGGIAPGSMPGASKTLSEEGVVIPPSRLVVENKLMENELRQVLGEGEFPARNPEQNIHDIRAQLAANQKAVIELVTLSEKYGAAKIVDMAEYILDYSHKKIKKVLQGFDHGSGLTQITPNRHIKLTVENKGNEFVLDFEGTSPSGQDNFNTPAPVVKASALFALRCLIEENIPLNDGIARYLNIKIPSGSLLNPKPENAVVAGNVETSQVISDLIFEVLGVKAHSQGTMNNLSFGNEAFQYYETLGGGSGATASRAGASAVQVNMTNSRLTDPEVFETRLPARIELMGIRHGSGGGGSNRGGDGLIRKILFLEDCSASMISQRRLSSPAGIMGAENGLCGLNILERKTGGPETLGECFYEEIKKGDLLTVFTPGGGGFGKVMAKDGNLVFGYGSNMDLIQIRHRCPSAHFVCKAQLHDFELRYSIYSEVRQGGVADTYHAPGESMHGVVYRMNDLDLAILDEIECGNGHYKRVRRKVERDDGKVLEVFCYDVNDKDPDVEPTNIYRWLVYSGAYMLGCSKKYLDRI